MGEFPPRFELQYVAQPVPNPHHWPVGVAGYLASLTPMRSPDRARHWSTSFFALFHFFILLCPIEIHSVVYCMPFSNLCLCNTFNLNDCSISRWHCLQARSRRHRLREKINVNLIHRSKVLHVRQINIVLDDLLEGGPGEFEDFLQVLQDRSLQFVSGDLEVSRDWTVPLLV